MRLRINDYIPTLGMSNKLLNTILIRSTDCAGNNSLFYAGIPKYRLLLRRPRVSLHIYTSKINYNLAGTQH